MNPVPNENFTATLCVSGVGMLGSLTSWMMTDGFFKWVSAIVGAAVGVSTIYFMYKKDQREAKKMEVFLMKERLAVQALEHEKRKPTHEEVDLEEA
jgi:uncharacterized membrane protein